MTFNLQVNLTQTPDNLVMGIATKKYSSLLGQYIM